MIQLEKDFSSRHGNKLLPILDLEIQVHQPLLSKLYYFYYRKPMANWQVMPAASAMPSSVKRTCLTQYGLRILRNTKLEVPWSKKAAMLIEFSARLRDSGYSERFCQEIIKSILRGWDKIVEDHSAGRRPIN